MAGTAYKVIWQPGFTCAVEVTEPDRASRIVSPFERETDARAWIAEAKWKAATATSKSRPRSPKKPS